MGEESAVDALLCCKGDKKGIEMALVQIMKFVLSLGAVDDASGCVRMWRAAVEEEENELT